MTKKIFNNFFPQINFLWYNKIAKVCIERRGK